MVNGKCLPGGELRGRDQGDDGIGELLGPPRLGTKGERNRVPHGFVVAVKIGAAGCGKRGTSQGHP